MFLGSSSFFNKGVSGRDSYNLFMYVYMVFVLSSNVCNCSVVYGFCVPCVAMIFYRYGVCFSFDLSWVGSVSGLTRRLVFLCRIVW